MPLGFTDPEDGMNAGKTLFAQVMEFVPWKTFGRIVIKHKGDSGVRTLGCADLFRILAFSQLTWRESLRESKPAWRPIRLSCFTWGWRRHLLDPRSLMR
jgi:hypothetical protein